MTHFLSAIPKLWVMSFTIFDSWPFHHAKNCKTLNTVSGYKKGSKIISDMSFDPQPAYCERFHLLCLTQDHLSSQKLKNVKYPFWLQKEVKNHIRYVFSDPLPSHCGWFHLIFWTLDPFIKPKVWENVKYRFWLQKDVKNHIRYVLLIRDPKIVGGFI